jgi:succinate-semialdehyde dehydrogenase / glutarate-semialdehyde dehydrogenase
MMEKLNYVNGEWIGTNLEKMEVHNPATGEVVGVVPVSGVSITKTAIDAAYDAFQTWSQTTAYVRAEYLEKLHEKMLDSQNEIAEIMTLEMGKPFKESKGEVQYAASFLKWFAEEGKRIYGRIIPAHKDGKRMQVIKQPVGVVAAITPWNFPAAMITRKLAPALAAGCTFVVKPPKEAPLTAIKLVELCDEVGIPKGVVNLVTGKSSDIGGELLSNPKVRKVTFTGSTQVGKELMKQAADTMKKISLELGGHAPLIILDDADIDKAANEAVASKFRNSGQTCICANRIYVQEAVYDQFVEKFKLEVSKLRVGNGLDDTTDIGPLINKAAYEKVEEHVEDAIASGAKCVLGGRGEQSTEGTYFYEPTILTDISDEMLVMHEETFGPVAPVQKVKTDEEVIRLANSTPYGLAAYIFTENYRRGIQLAEKLDYGIIGWNDGVPSSAQAPFGGMKESGLGREGGVEGIEEYLETKYISIGL